MWSSIIAVLGTLAGGVLTWLAQRATTRQALVDAHRREVSAAVAELLAAVVRYREIHWLSIAALRAGEPPSTDRAEQFAARSAVTVARDRLGLLVTDQALLDAAEAASWSALELSGILLGPVGNGRFTDEVETALEEGRERSRDAHTALRRAGTAYIHYGR